jgi:hypothetical protein
MFFDSFKLMAGIIGAGFAWIADIATAGADGLPSWVNAYGLPGVFLALTIYAVRTLFSANQQMQRDALAAKDAQTLATKAQSDLFLATTRELIDATNHQTTQLQKLTDEIKSRPCQMPQEQFPFRRKQEPVP